MFLLVFPGVEISFKISEHYNSAKSTECFAHLLTIKRIKRAKQGHVQDRAATVVLHCFLSPGVGEVRYTVNSDITVSLCKWHLVFPKNILHMFSSSESDKLKSWPAFIYVTETCESSTPKHNAVNSPIIAFQVRLPYATPTPRVPSITQMCQSVQNS